MRDVEDRLTWYKANRPSAAGMCAQHVMLALDVPKQGFDDATEVYRFVAARGRINTGVPPRGSILYWSGGSEGHGHVCFSLGGGQDRSVDVNGPRTVGDKPHSWFKENWPSLRYHGWSWWWGGINTEEETVAWRKVLEVGDKTLPDGVYNSVGTIILPDPDADYLLTLQCRLPAGTYARVQFDRVGWGSGETGNQPLTPPDEKATSFTHNHTIKGGGPVSYEIKPYGPSSASVVTTIICKALRIG